jgi:hypothetical protein
VRESAPVSLLLEWVSEALREPGHPFELSVPRGKALQDMTMTLQQAELAPASLLNFRVQTAELCGPPFLHPALMRKIEQLGPEHAQIPQGRPLVAGAPEAPIDAQPALMAGPRTPRWAPQ